MKQITSRIYQINLGAVNTFIVEDNGLTLIDTGYKGSAEKIFAALKKAGRSPSDIKRIILTHGHPDHTGSAARIKKILGVPVYAYHTDAELIEQDIGGRLPLQLTPGLVNWLVYRIFIKPNGAAIEAVTVDHHLHDGDIIPVAGGMQVIHTPGHSAGHMVLLVPEENILIAGDLCMNVMGPGFSTVNEDRAQSLQSILKVAGLPFDKAVFGHGGPVMSGANSKLQKKFTPLNHSEKI